MAGGVRSQLVGFKAFRDRLRQPPLAQTRENLHARLDQIWRIAGELFVREAMRGILIETGMSAASFFPLSRAINRERALQAVRGKLTRRGQGFTNSGVRRRTFRIGIPELPDGKRSSGIQNPAAGQARGQKGYIFTTGGPNRLVLRFSFRTLVFQLAFHEENRQAVEAAAAVFEEAVRARIRRAGIITLEEFVGIRKIRKVRSPSGREII